ncbi:MAG: hypothetical protein BWY70_00849 [Bacteroidetes bacterium ADurb.Bin408]|nr:MAG: hypothetical protein BWY70_00849 [Bacteroidetes bacterium ADurb.Bin408]
MTLFSYHLTSVYNQPETVQSHPFYIFFIDFIHHKVKGKVGKPCECGFFPVYGLYKQLRNRYPVEWADMNTGYAIQHGQMKSSHKSHIVIKWQPANHFVGSKGFKCFTVGCSMSEQHFMGYHYGFLESGSAR